MYRIRRTEQGFVVEHKKAKWTLFGIKYIWKPFLVYRGTNDVYHFHNTIIAKEKFVEKMLKQLEDESKKIIS